jgi:hypothetical protein
MVCTTQSLVRDSTSCQWSDNWCNAVLPLARDIGRQVSSSSLSKAVVLRVRWRSLRARATSDTSPPSLWPRMWRIAKVSQHNEGISMTSLLIHAVAHSYRPSYRPKTNNQPLKKFFVIDIFRQLQFLNHFIF